MHIFEYDIPSVKREDRRAFARGAGRKQKGGPEGPPCNHSTKSVAYFGISAVMPSTKKFSPESSPSSGVLPSASHSEPSCFFSGPVKGW